MELRRKFVLLALIYVLSLSANLAISAYCITVYIDSAFQDFQTGAVFEQHIDGVRRILNDQRTLLTESERPAEIEHRYLGLDDELNIAMGALVRAWPELLPDNLVSQLRLAMDRKRQAVGPYLGEANPPRVGGELPEELASSFAALTRVLAEASTIAGEQRQMAVTQAADTQSRVVQILVINTAAGGLLCALGVYFVRSWVLTPVGQLREATKQISQGHFEYRISTRARDELGKLAGEVNQMAATIVDMQTKMVEQERLAAAGEMVTRLAHNIRNPLAGIRGLSETTIDINRDDAETVGCQERIIATVDRFEKWLRDLQQSVSPMTVNVRPVAIEELLEATVSALRPMLERRGVSVKVEVDPTLKEVSVDAMHLEQAVVSLLTNAAQASASGMEIQIRAERIAGEPNHWCLIVQDQGGGIPPEIREKIFEPYFTTKPDGNGIGLAMTQKVVRLHGGRLSVESDLGKGSRFEIRLPGAQSEA